MARSRLIRPEFWNDEKLATLSRDSRLTFVGMWTASDDYGTAKGHLTWLKNQIFPYENINKDTFEKWINELESIGAIIPFSYHQEKYYFIRNFPKHQKIDHPSKQRNPEPPANILESVATQSLHNRVETETKTETETIEKKRQISKIREKDSEEVYEFYKKNIKPGPKRDSIINIKKLLNNGKAKADLMGYTINYAEFLKKNGKTDKVYWIQPNNFFGEKERYQEYLTPPKLKPEERDLNKDGLP